MELTPAHFVWEMTVASLPKSQPCSQAPQYPPVAVSGVGRKEGYREESGAHRPPDQSPPSPTPCTRVSLNLGGEAQSSQRFKELLTLLQENQASAVTFRPCELGPSRNTLVSLLNVSIHRALTVLGKGHIASEHKDMKRVSLKASGCCHNASLPQWRSYCYSNQRHHWSPYLTMNITLHSLQHALFHSLRFFS